MIPSVAVSAASQLLVHAPGLACHGSKPSRELPRDPELASAFRGSLRSHEQAVAYAPHQAFIGNLHPRQLPPRPWATRPLEGSSAHGPDGDLLTELELLGAMAAVDEFDLLVLDPAVAERAAQSLARRPSAAGLVRTGGGAGVAEAAAGVPGAIPLRLGAAEEIAGAVRAAHDSDEALSATVLLENLVTKATATLALLHLLHDRGIDPGSIDYVISCSEEAVGDRYQRGGGNMAKAVAGAAGLSQASGADVKNFCAGPLSALVVAGSLVAAGVFSRVAVVGGGSLPKLGMKFQGHLSHGLPVLEDVLGACALIVEAGDGSSPRLRLDAVGRHRVAAGASGPQIMEALAFEPLGRVGLRALDVDDYATELHDPDVTEPQGSGNVPERNYRILAALAVRRGEIGRDGIDAFVAERGMPGFAPTQGHVASALCYLPHALRRLGPEGSAERVMLLAKGSLFLGRMSQLSDGMSVLLTRGG
jgi:glycine/sarcosine/betaine reductase complex component C subunit beta